MKLLIELYRIEIKNSHHTALRNELLIELYRIEIIVDMKFFKSKTLLIELYRIEIQKTNYDDKQHHSFNRTL